MPKPNVIQAILISAAAAFCGVGALAMTNDKTASLQARVDAILSECGYAGHMTFTAIGGSQVQMTINMEAFKKDGPENEASVTAFSCVTQELKKIPNLSLGFTGNEAGK